MRRLLAIVSLVLAGCGDAGIPSPDGGAAPRLEPGAYRLDITSSVFGPPSPRFSLAMDGHFTGHASYTLWECEGVMGPAELASLTDALNRADVLRRASSQNPMHCNDFLTYYVKVEAPALGLANQFTYLVCPGSDA